MPQTHLPQTHLHLLLHSVNLHQVKTLYLYENKIALNYMFTFIAEIILQLISTLC